ncbi:MAG: DUF3738 domain-containing protein [Sphingobacteriales bacterium]|nr:MAG: DUF3738 domain-containing protein [Sphingobacteriales bacterium]
MKLLFCISIFLCPYGSGAYPATDTVPLKPGDQVRTLIFKNMYNYKAAQLNVKKTGAQLIILDFWATWCGPCLKKFPMLDSLRFAHKGALEVILVSSAGTNDDLARVKTVFARLNKAQPRPLSLPVTLHDVAAKKLFPHKGLPHYAWLSASGKVLAITDGEAVTPKNITAAINGQALELPLQFRDPDFDISKPFLTNDAFTQADLLFSSSVTNAVAGVGRSFYSNRQGNLVSNIRCLNSSLQPLLFYAYDCLPSKNNILVETTAPERFNGRYCYELITPVMPVSDALLLMQADLHRFFGVRLKREVRLRDVYILTADPILLKTTVAQPGASANTLNDTGDRRLVNRPLEELQFWLTNKMDLPVVDETDFTQPVSLQLEDTSFSLAALNSQLNPLGLTLSPVQRRIDCFIIY